MRTDCLLCSAERVTPWHLEDDDCWVADCMVCATPMVVWRTHGLPDPELEAQLLSRLEQVAEARLERSGKLSVIKTRPEPKMVEVAVAEGVQIVRVELG